MGRQLDIGWGRRSLVPNRPVAIPGQFHLRISKGMFNPVTVNALAIDNGDDAVIFVSADIVVCRGGTLDKTVAKLKAMAPEVPADKIVMNATHTHAGPGATSYERVNELDMLSSEETIDFISTRTAEAVAEAWKNRAPGKVAYGYGFATVAHSRRVIYLDDLSKRPDAAARPGIMVDGHGKMYGNTDDPQFSHYEAGTDSFINLLYTFDPNGKLTGAIVNVPCPGQTGEHTWVLHSGFWHNVREKIRARHGDIGIIAQCAAAGDLSPRQLHYKQAELRRYKLKYPEKYADLCEHPFPYPKGFFRTEAGREKRRQEDILDMLRAEDIGERVSAAFDEVLEWAGKEKLAAPELRHAVRTVKLDRRLFPEDIYREECENYRKLMEKEWQHTDNPDADLRDNSILSAARARCRKVKETYENQNTDRRFDTTIHAVRIGDAAFVSNRFELFMDYMHRMQARSPFVQTFIVQLTAVPGLEGGTYLPTERAVANKGYSASPYCNLAAASGGQQLVEASLEMLKTLNE